MKTRDMTKIALMAALLCVLGPMTVPIGDIPLTLANLAVMLCGALLGPVHGALAVVIYLLIGVAGVPVFSNYGSGIGKLAGATGGFLVGYIPCAFLSGLGVVLGGTGRRRYWMLPLMMAAGTAVLYALGMAWFMVVLKTDMGNAYQKCVAGFLAVDSVKIVIASVVVWPIRQALSHLSPA